MIASHRFSLNDVMVWLVVIREIHMDRTGFPVLSYQQIARKAKMAKSSVARSMQKLIEAKMLAQTPGDGQKSGYGAPPWMCARSAKGGKRNSVWHGNPPETRPQTGKSSE